jgi:hypothetical protein
MLRKIAPAIVTNANNCKGEILPGRVPVRSCMILPPRQERRPQPPVSCKDCQRLQELSKLGTSRYAAHDVGDACLQLPLSTTQQRGKCRRDCGKIKGVAVEGRQSAATVGSLVVD